jgi:hypothetical protein
VQKYYSLPKQPMPQEHMELTDASCWLAKSFRFVANEGAVTWDLSGRLIIDWYPPLSRGGYERYKCMSISNTGCSQAVGWGFSPRTALQSLAVELDRKGMARSSRALELSSQNWPEWMLS